MADRTISDLIREDSSGAAPVESTAAAGPELGRIKANVAKMIEQGAPEHDIDAYIAGEGTSLDAVKAFKPKPESWGDYGYGLLQKAGQGATFGYGDELAAGAGAVGNKVMRGVGVDVPELNYDQILSGIRGEQKTFEGNHPYQGMAAEIAVAIASAIVAAPAVAATLLGRVVASALYCGVYGGISGFGNSEGGFGNRVAGGTKGAIVGGVAGPVLSDVVLPAAGRIAGATKDAYRYAAGAAKSFRDPEQAAINNVADRMLDSGLDPATVRNAVSPQPSANLTGRNFTAADMADIISRAKAGDTHAAIATDYGLHPTTVGKYVKTYEDNNPTPLNIIDLAKETANDGGAAPLTRLGRASYSLSGDESNVAAQKLIGRQDTQPGRVTNIIQRSVAGGDFEATRAAGLTKLKNEANTAYKPFYAEPDLATNELGDLLEDPVFKQATIQAQQQARVAVIRRNQEGARAARTSGASFTPEPVPTVEADNEVFSPEMLDKIQRQLRIRSEGFASDPNAAHHAGDLRNVFLDRIEDHYPTFKGIRKNYATGMGEFGEEGALEAGRDLTNKLGATTSEALRGFDQYTPAQQDLFRLGFARHL